MSRQGRPVGLIIAVVGLTAAALLLWLILKSGDEDASASRPAPAGGSAAVAQVPPVRAGDDRPGIPQVADSEEGRRGGGAADRPATETIVNGVRVRDHRRDRSQPFTIPSRPSPVHARRLPTEITAEINNRLLPIVRECGSSVPPEARGAKPRLEGQVVIAIKNQQIQVTEVTIELTDVVGAPLEPAKQCLQQKALGVTAPAADEADLDGYPIHISYALP